VSEDRTPYERRRVTVAEAAEVLGISAEAVRMRLRRGTLDSERHEGTIYVLLDTDQTRHVTDTSTDRTDLLIAEMQERIRSLEEANRENRRLLAAALERIPAIEAPQSDESAPETASESSERVEPSPASTEPSEALRRRKTPWWRRVFGG